jgi:hypothetical protein
MRLLGAFCPNTLDGTMAGAAIAAMPVLRMVRRVLRSAMSLSQMRRPVRAVVE